MFCSKCGEKLGELVSFCPKCGAKIVNDTPNGSQSIDQPLDNQVSIQKNTKPIIVLSIIGSLFSLICFVAFLEGLDKNYYENYLIVICLIFLVFSLMHAIIVLVLANKFRFKATKIMATIFLVLLTCYSLPVLLVGEYAGFFVIALYSLAFSIVSFIQSKEKNIS